ncbi:MAG: SH3 domain-containing protein [Anaerolineae bacterium]
MRSGPSTDNNVLAAVPSGASVLVLGFNADRSWVNVQIEDGRQGWISAALLEIRESGAPASKRNQIPPRRQDIDEGEDATSPARPTRPPSATPTASPTTLVAETLEATITPTRTTAPPSTTPRPSRTPSPTATLEPTSEATAEATPEAIAPSGRETGYRDERWYAMNLGIIASALIITFGAVVNIARGLLRRGRRR